jgi:hypothetical protein
MALGQFVSKSAGQKPPGSSAAADFISRAQQNGYEVIGTQVGVNTPLGRRYYDLVIRNADGTHTGVEIKSSYGAFTRSQPSQFAADRYLNNVGGLSGIGRYDDLTIDNSIKILWPLP